MKVVITCPRAPVAVEWANVVRKSGDEIILVDSLRLPIGRFFPDSIYIRVASPKIEPQKYQAQMIDICMNADWVIPNCEDVFYLSKVKDSVISLSKESNKPPPFFLMPNSDILFNLHHKFNFFEYLNDIVEFPITKYLDNKSQIDTGYRCVLKPVYSRFGNQVIRAVDGVKKHKIDKVNMSLTYPWVQQEYIEGSPLCNYAICINGNVVSHVVYRPKYLLNKAAATYFECLQNKRLDQFIERFAKDNKFTGQVAFDFIEADDQIYVLECNPRATSGLHLLAQNLQFINKKLVVVQGNNSQNACRVGVSLFVFFGLEALYNKQFGVLLCDYKRARDVIKPLPWYAQFLSLIEMLWRSIKYKRSLTSASTFDIEYDGDDDVRF